MAKTFRLVYLSLLVALSLTLFMFEGLLPVPFLAPGAKLGLANIVTVVALCTMPRWQDALLVLVSRIVLATLLGGGPAIMAYSLAGGILSFTGMVLLRRTGCFTVIGFSAAGGFLHNVGQLMIASAAIGGWGLFTYLPILGPCGLLTGGVIGWLAALLVPRLQRYIDGRN